MENNTKETRDHDPRCFFVAKRDVVNRVLSFLSTTMTDAEADNSQLAASLKDAGNRLFTQKNYQAAHEEYTKAIALDPQNAILWANRSACHLSLKQYVQSLFCTMQWILTTEQVSGRVR